MIDLRGGETIEGNEFTMLDTVRGSLNGYAYNGYAYNGERVSLQFHYDNDNIGSKGYVSEHFTGNVGLWNANGLKRPAGRKGFGLTADDLLTALDAAVSFASSAKGEGF